MIAKTLHIREANSDDVPVLSGLIRHSFRDVAERFRLTRDNCPKHPSYCTDDWIDTDFARGVTYYILERGGTPVGCVALEKASPDLYYLERLAVLPQYRRNGFGKALVDYVLLEAKAVGAKKLDIGIIAEQSELKLWYQQLGFVEGETKEFEHLPFLVTFMTYAC
jgi:N-acetylglutamate synthase-like GNAT family acetyltransferase